MPSLASVLKPKRNKFGAKGFRDLVGRWWSSKWEFDRFVELEDSERKGWISNLKRQVKYPLIVNKKKIATYIADAVYEDSDGNVVVEDAKCKATMTAAYRLKKKLMLALFNIQIQEVYRKK